MRTVEDLRSEIWSLGGVDTADYLDAYTVAADGVGVRPTEYWARALMEVAGSGAQFAWRVILGLRLAPRSSSDHVGGWTIVDRGDGWIKLGAESWSMGANIALIARSDQLTVVTIIHRRNPFASLIWRPVSIFHRRAVPRFLRQLFGDRSLRVEQVSGLERIVRSGR